jgi:chromosome segregation ATPase
MPQEGNAVKVSRVKIEGFGKFQSREFNFLKGLNIIYGPNESGKTTLTQFILYTLSGFNSEEAEKYRPWNGDKFGGKVVLETKEGEKTLEFNPERPLNDVLVSREEFESSSYIPEEGGLEISSGISGTIIAKLRKKMETMEKVGRIIEIIRSEQRVREKLMEEERKLKEKLKNAREKVEEHMKMLENEKSIRKRYIALKKKLKDLNKRLKEISEKLLASKVLKAREIWNKMEKIKSEISSLNAEIEDLKKFENYSDNDLQRIKEIRHDVENLKREKERFQQVLSKREEEKRFMEQRKKVLEESLKISEDEDIDKILLKIKNLELTLRMLEEKKKPEGFDRRWEFFESTPNIERRIKEIEDHLERLERFENSLNDTEREIESAEREMSEIRSKINLRNALTTVFLILSGVLIAGGYLIGAVFYLSIIAAVLTGLSLALFLSAGELRRAKNNLEGERERLQIGLEVMRRKVSELRNVISSLMEGSKFASSKELLDEYKKYTLWKKEGGKARESEEIISLERELVERLEEFFDEVKGDYSKLVNDLKEKISEYIILKEKISTSIAIIENLRDSIEKVQKKLDELLNESEELFEKLNCRSYRDCEIIEESKKRYQHLMKEREKLESKLADLEKIWEEYIEYHNQEIPDSVDLNSLEPIEVIERNMKETVSEISELEKIMKRLEDELERVQVDREDYYEKLNTMERTKLELEMCEEEIKSFPVVLKVLADIKEEFVKRYKDVFERRFKVYSEKIIGRGFDIEVGDDLSLKIRSKSERIENLSRATRDQIELAYKLSLYDSLDPSDPYPLLIDNSLTRYDDERLKATLEILKEVAKKRQIILTTSDTRILKLVPKRSIKKL